MTSLTNSVRAIPLWCKTTVVLTLGIALSIWFTVELTLSLDQKYLHEKLHNDTQRATELLAGLLKETVLTRNKAKTDSIIKQYAGDWPDITFLHIEDEHAHFFTEWKKQPVSFGEGILKYEAPIVVNNQKFGTLSLYLDQRDRLNSIQEHVSAIERRVALTLFAMMLFISAIVSYAAMHPIKSISDKLFGVMQTAARSDTENIGPDEISRLKSALAFIQKLLDQAQHGKDNASRPGGEN